MEWLSAKEFKAFWRKLVKSGWKARRPRDLSVDYTYVKPGVTGKLNDAERGENYFVELTNLYCIEYPTQVAEIAENPSDDEEEEAKRDEGSADDVAVFDTENFMEALRSEQLFGPVPADDVNVCTDDDQGADDDDDDAEDDGDALGVPAAPLEYESEVESDSDFEDDSDAFAQDDDAMRGLRWRVFDQNKSGKSVSYRIL
ncbi:hypothetical protein AM587_10002377 [Phytophthora nicotianae]|uniref:Uncharacterized protein n=1 Tax=Phytophthora nicotianae TaxID=4792 RepID=A0A0W8CN55_PHYNI|nr:hypothetical protein AM587_10002377 [Phytophthora nicotianae]